MTISRLLSSPSRVRFSKSLPWLMLGLLSVFEAHADDFLVGVHTRLANNNTPKDKPFQLMKDAGITAVRDDAFWSTVEQQPGVMHISPDWWIYLQAARNANMKTLMMLGYGNQFYSSDSKPIYPTVRTGFSRFVDYTARQLRGKVDFYEVYNEWDLEDSISPAFSDAYVELVKETSKQLRKIDTKAKIVAGAVTSYGIKMGFADRMIEAGVLDYVDGLSLHPYVHCEKTNNGNTPESWVKWMTEVSSHLNKVAGKDVPIYLTEMAWHSTGSLHPCGVTESTQASFLARAYLLAKTVPAIKGMWWYDLANDGLDPAEQEHNFGILEQDFTPKPAYDVLKSMTPILSQYQYQAPKEAATAETVEEDLYLLDFAKEDEHVLAAWVIGKPRQVKIESIGPVEGAVKLVDTAHPTDGRVDSETRWQCSNNRCFAVLTLSESPKLINVGKANWLFTK